MKQLSNPAIQRKPLVCECQATLQAMYLEKQVIEQCAKLTKLLGFVCAELLGTSKAPKRVAHSIFLSSGTTSAILPKYGFHSQLAY